MKNHLTLIFLFTISLLYSQEYDSSFADDGVLIVPIPIIDILEDDENLYFKGNSEIMSVRLDGSIRQEFGDDGLIIRPLGSLSQNISNFLFYDDKLILLGSGSEFSESHYDIYVNQLDLKTGERIEEFKYEQPDTSNQYLRSYFFDDEIHLYGSSVPHKLSDGTSNSDLYSTFDLAYNPDANDLSSVNLSELSSNNTEPLIPFDFFQLSDGRLLINCLTKHLSNQQTKIINNISEIGTLDSAETINLIGETFNSERYIEIEPLSIVVLRVSSEASNLQQLDLSDNIVDTIALDFLDENIRLFSACKYDKESFLLFGYETIEDKADKLIVYSVKNNFELNENFADNGILELLPQLNGNTIRGMISFRTDKHVYLRILTREVLGGSNLIRFKYPTSSIYDEQSVAFSIYPIPATDILFVSGNKDNPNATYKIQNLSGRTVKEGKLNNNKVDIKAIGSGLYYLAIRDKKGQLVTKSFIVE